ncbi:haloalkane dehalogenase [Pseudonocardia oroxyli]|uniref:Haloalkane dehalogenase n=1 Tax=Pseudonocardia oroxyli TaxID=366584 RepID=A0A1G7PCJ0_PSEOR|nr:haloalkane dehalogenase [Pseudonocardia oroxyli]SDF84016.1 haloalkane dehalogenase [Pseudonocardia oroxyli]
MPDTRFLDSVIHHEERGTGPAWVFLHGNPASSHLWRGVLERMGPGRLLAPDLIGMGASGKPDIGYRFADHARYLDAWFDALGLDDVVLVGHDWGGALAFDHAARHPGRVRGVAFLEAVIRPMTWADLGPAPRARAELVRGPGGEEFVLGSTAFVDAAFTGGVCTPVADLEPYRAPFPDPPSRRPILEWARSLPLDGEPADVHDRIAAFQPWLTTSDVPKLLVTFEGSPTLMVGPELRRWCLDHVARLSVVHGGRAGHHAPEDRPAEIAAALTAWADARFSA